MTTPNPPEPDLLATNRRFLNADLRHHDGALDVVLEHVEAIAIGAWVRAEGKPGAERLLAAIAAAAEFLEGLTVELPGEQPEEPPDE
jgi:hypothetical protein